MLPEALIERGRQVATPLGYTQGQTAWTLRITSKGEFISMTKERWAGHLPSVVRTMNVKPNSGLDNYQHVLGVGAPGRETSWARKFHLAYREVLKAAPGQAAKALLTFLDHPSRPLILPIGDEVGEEEKAQILSYLAVPCSEKGLLIKKQGSLQTDPMVQGAYGCIVANAKAHHPAPNTSNVLFVDDNSSSTFFVEVGGDSTWHLTPEFQAFHRGRDADPSKQVRGTCSLCHQEDTVLARIFPTGKLSLVTFQHRSCWSSYGAEQAYNVPTCENCAHLFVQGQDHIVGPPENKGNKEQVGKKLILWWPNDARSPPLFSLLRTALDKTTNDADREKALEAFTDGHVAVVEELMGRTSVQRYYTTTASEVRANVQRWRATIGPRGVFEMSHLFLTRAQSQVKGATNPHGLALHMNLIAGEEIPASRVRMIRALMDEESEFDKRREDLLHYVQGSDSERTTPDAEETTSMEEVHAPGHYTTRQKAAFWYGMAFGKAETNQRGRSNPQRTIGVTHYSAARRSAATASTICMKFRSFVSTKIQNGKTTRHQVDDKLLSAWLSDADLLLSESPGASSFSREEQIAFDLGYLTYKRVRKQMKATTTDTTTDTE